MGTLRRTCRLSQRRGRLPKLLWADLLLLLLRTINHMLRISAIIFKWDAEPRNEILWHCALLQFNVKKRLVYGAIVLIWILLPAHEIIFSYLSTDIIAGTCVPMGVINGYNISWNILITSYVLPLIAMVFCYTRIVHKLRRKVTQNSIKPYFPISKSKSKSKYLLKAYNKRISTVQCGYMQIESITKTWTDNL